MTIAEVSERYGFSPDTLRYYELIGLIPAVHRTKGGVRDYDESDVRWVKFVKCMRRARLTIEVLIEYVGLCQQGMSQSYGTVSIPSRRRISRRRRALRRAGKRLYKEIEVK